MKKIFTSAFIGICTVVTCFISYIPAQAALISTDDTVFGKDSITKDTETGFEWLDLTFTIGKSYNEVSQLFDKGNTFAGFRYATSNEVAKLFLNAGITEINISNPLMDTTEANTIPSEKLISLVGATYFSNGNKSAFGTTGTSRELGFRNLAYLYFQNSDNNNDIVVASTDNYAYNESAKLPFAGSWLVRESTKSVPESTTSYLILLGFGGFGSLITKRKYKSIISEKFS